jgi:ribosomal protein L44E
MQKISIEKTGTKRGSLKKGSIKRAKIRGRGRGYGNLGKWGSKPAISAFKRTGSKTSKMVALKLICKECKKSVIQTRKKAKKAELKEK